VRRDIRTDTQAVYEQVSDAFHRQYPNLIVEMSYGETEVTLHVTAEGRREQFPRVLKVVRGAPHIPGFKVEAFRPRGKIDGIELQIADRKIGMHDVWCSAEPEGDQLRVTLWVRGLDDDSRRVLTMGAKVLLDHTVGEFDAGTKIASLDYERLPDNPEENALLFPLAELPNRLDELPKVEM
jgi:hypothetical protein